MVVLPAWALGLLFVFGVGYVITAILFDAINTGDNKKQPSKSADVFSIIGGIFAVAFVLFLLFRGSSEVATKILIGLIVLGFIVSLLSFFLFSNEQSTNRSKNYSSNYYFKKKNARKSQKKKTANAHKTKVYDARRNPKDVIRDYTRKKERAQYRTDIREQQKKQSRLNIVKNDLSCVFSFQDSDSLPRCKLLEKILFELFDVNDILINQIFELSEQDRKELNEHITGVIDFDGHSFFVELMWSKDPIGLEEASQHLVRVFSTNLSCSLLMSNSGFTQQAIATCKEALKYKVVVLCEIEEIICLLEKKYCLKEFLRTKIEAAIEEENPIYKPLTY